MVLVDTTYPNNTIKIGQNARDNDLIVSEAEQTDVWFHLADYPSCHLIISVNEDHPIDKQMIIYCSQLVKSRTKYKNIPKLTINYCPIKQVHRTKTKGLVTLSGVINKIVI